MKYLILFSFLSGFMNCIMDTIVHHMRNQNGNWVDWLYEKSLNLNKKSKASEIRSIIIDLINKKYVWIKFNDAYSFKLGNILRFPFLFWLGTYYFTIRIPIKIHSFKPFKFVWQTICIYPFKWVAIYKDGWHFAKWWSFAFLGIAGIWANDFYDLIIISGSWLAGFFPLYQTYRIWR